MVKENLPGLMVEDILENIKKIKNMDMESSNGLVNNLNKLNDFKLSKM